MSATADSANTDTDGLTEKRNAGIVTGEKLVLIAMEQGSNFMDLIDTIATAALVSFMSRNLLLRQERRVPQRRNGKYSGLAPIATIQAG